MKKKCYILLLLFLLMPEYILTKVLIITHSYNRPDFIEIQYKTFKAFLQNEYEYVVFNDAPEKNMEQQIEKTCNKLGIQCYRVPQHLHNVPGRQSAGHRHIDCIRYSLEQLGYDYNGIVALIDSDMFLIKPFSMEKYLQGNDIAGELQGRSNNVIEVRYLSPVFVLMNMQTLPNKRTISFEGGYIEGLLCDVGAHTYYYFKNNPSIKPLFFGCFHIGTMKFNLNCQTCTQITCVHCVQHLIDNKFDFDTIRFIQGCSDNIEFFLDHTFLHYRSGSNWNGKDQIYHQQKTAAVNKYLDIILSKSNI